MQEACTSRVRFGATIMNTELERAEHANRIRPIAADYDEWGVTNIRLQIRELANDTFVHACIVTFDNGDEIVQGGRPTNTDTIISDTTFPTLVALTDEQPAMAEAICNHIEGGFR